MTLHEAILFVLKEAARPMTAVEIADEIRKRNLYRKRNGEFALANQIHARVNNYPELFRKAGGLITTVRQASPLFYYNDLDIIQEIERLYNIELNQEEIDILDDEQGFNNNFYLLEEQKKVTAIGIAFENLYDFPQLISLLKRLEHLEVLVLNSNEIDDFSGIEQLTQIDSLYITPSAIHPNLEKIRTMFNLQTLSLKNLLRPDFSFIKNLTQLTSLTLEFNMLSDLSFLSKMKNLYDLQIKNNKLNDISQLTVLKKLSTLNLNNNEITDISPLKGLKNLEILNLDNNKIQNINPIISLKKLEFLSIQDNYIQDISSIKNILTNIEFVRLENNQIKQIPEKLKDCYYHYKNDTFYLSGRSSTKRNFIFLTNNPFTDPPIEIIKMGDQAVKRYFRSKNKKEFTTIREAKLILVGDGASGKTSLQKRLLDENAPLPKEEERTRGIAVEDWEFKKDYIAHIWDFGGQDVYYPVHRFFLTENAVFVLLASTRYERNNFDYWLPTIQQFGGDSPIIIGQTCHGGNTVPWNDIETYLCKEEYTIIKTSRKPYFELNLPAGNRGLDIIREEIKNQLFRLADAKKEIPLTWIKVKMRLKEIAENEPCIHFYKFKEIYREETEPDTSVSKNDYTDCCRFLHNIGSIFWYFRNPLLKDCVILQPEWAMQAVYQIIDDLIIQEQNGHICAGDFARIWKNEIYQDRENILKQMLTEFRVAFPKRDKPDYYLLPTRLPSIPPEKRWKDKDCLILEYKYDILPRGIVNQVSAEMSQFIRLDKSQNEEVWNNAVNFMYLQSECQLTEDIHNKVITICARGKDANGLKLLVKEKLDLINSQYKMIKTEIMVPCNCKACRHGEKSSRFSYSDLVRWTGNGRDTATCNESDTRISIDSLLHTAGLPDLSKKNLVQQLVTPHKINIFLASSNELAPERKEFEIYIGRRNKELHKRGIFLNLTIWEDYTERMSATSLQDEYNKAVRSCHIFIGLFYSKVGKYTRKEFEVAYSQFKKTGKPAIYTYFKDIDPPKGVTSDDLKSLEEMQVRLKELEHFPSAYTCIEDLQNKFTSQLQKWFEENRLAEK